MKIDRGAMLALLCLSLVATAAESDKPGGKRICVPSEDGRSWVCGTTDAPPPERGLPATRNTGPSPEPPPFLADPSAGRASAPAVDLRAPASEPPPPDRFESAPPEASTAAAEPVAEEPVAAPEPLAAEPAGEVEPAPEPEPDASAPAVDIVGADAAQAGTPALLAAPRGEPEFPLSSEPAPTPSQAPDETASVEAAPDEAASVEAPAETAPVESSAEATIAAEEPAPIEEAPASEPVAAEPVVEEPVVEEPVVEETVVEQPVVEERVVEEPVVEAPAPAAPVAEPVVAEPAPAASEPGAEPSAPVDTVTTAPASPEPVAVAPQALATPPRNTSAFLVQVPTHYTLQLARAPSQSGFAALLGALGLRGEEAWAVPLSAGGATSWMLLWGDFADIDAARTAAAQLAPRVSAWPRRVAPIQDELRAAGTR